MRRLADPYRLTEPRRAIALLVVLALLLRLVGLGVRVAHWDEGRVGYWILRTAATGEWSYRPIIHGPFVQHVTRWTFGVLGPSDFAMRLPVAILGGLLPLSALLFRTRLRDSETVALALVLALNPLLVYFSRFMRSDVPVAAFAFVTLGAVVAAIDTDRRRYHHLAAVAFALALTAKENALLYPVSWLGALAMLAAGSVLYTYREGGDPVLATPRKYATASVRRLWSWRRTLLVLPVEVLAILVFFYAPRSPAPDAGLWSALADPTLLPGVIGEATLGSAAAFADLWLAPNMHAHPYAPFLAHFLATMAVAAAATTVLAVLGVRWRRRPLVAFCGWWALSGIVGYPYVADVKAPWLAVHVVIALAIPAAVGLVAVVERYRTATIDGSRAGSEGMARVGIARVGMASVGTARVGMAVLLIGSGIFVATSTAYTNAQPPHELNVVAQGAQPAGDLRPIVRDLHAVGEGHPGPDVLYYGDLAVANESHNDRPPAASNWYDRLPLPWYTEAANASVTSAAGPEDLPADVPPIVIANETYRDELEPRLPGYSAREEAVWLRPEPGTVGAFGIEYPVGGQTYVFFVDRDVVESASRGSNATSRFVR